MRRWQLVILLDGNYQKLGLQSWRSVKMISFINSEAKLRTVSLRQKTEGDWAHGNRDAGGLHLCGGLSLEAACSWSGGGAAVLSFQANHKVTWWDFIECHQKVTTSHWLRRAERESKTMRLTRVWLLLTIAVICLQSHWIAHNIVKVYSMLTSGTFLFCSLALYRLRNMYFCRYF